MPYNLRGPGGRFISRLAFERLRKQRRGERVAVALARYPGETPPVVFGENRGTAQIYSRGFEFAFMTPKDGVYHQVCTFVYCKDFLHDAVWACVNKTRYGIHGFSYDSARDLPLDMGNCVFAFRNTGYQTRPEEFHAQREACQQFLNQIEQQIGLDPTVIYQVPHPQAPCWLLVGDKGWQHAPPMVGFFTLFIRLGFAHILGEKAADTLQKAREGKIRIGDGMSYAGNRDAGYVASSWPAIEKLLDRGLEIFHPRMEDNYPAHLRTKGLHDYFGPVHFTRGITSPRANARQAMPFWYRDEIWKSGSSE